MCDAQNLVHSQEIAVGDDEDNRVGVEQLGMINFWEKKLFCFHSLCLCHSSFSIWRSTDPFPFSPQDKSLHRYLCRALREGKLSGPAPLK